MDEYVDNNYRTKTGVLTYILIKWKKPKDTTLAKHFPNPLERGISDTNNT
jgi:hypothetical protein